MIDQCKNLNLTVKVLAKLLICVESAWKVVGYVSKMVRFAWKVIELAWKVSSSSLIQNAMDLAFEVGKEDKAVFRLRKKKIMIK